MWHQGLSSQMGLQVRVWSSFSRPGNRATGQFGRCQTFLAFDLLLRAGRFPGKPPLADGDRIPLRAPINGDQACVLRNILVSLAGETWPGFSLPSGEVRFLTLVGVSDAEVAYAKTGGAGALAAALSVKGYYPVTDTPRQSLSEQRRACEAGRSIRRRRTRWIRSLRSYGEGGCSMVRSSTQTLCWSMPWQIAPRP
jgi:Suppressor of fused protein (SUFU)